MKQLVIVESPTKAKTLSRFLGDKFEIIASMGHVRDLPKAKIGVDVEHDYEPEYVIPKDKRKVVEHLKEDALTASEVILATDPDREGEAIAWHLDQLIAESKNSKLKSQKSKKNSELSTQHSELKRIVFHEITKEAVEDALKHPRTIDFKLVDAQTARRVLDRLVGYKLSPLLWFKVKKGLSAGRVQSIAVRLIVEREREVDAFVPQEYWSVAALLRQQGVGDRVQSKDEFEAQLIQKDGKKIEIKKKAESDTIVKDLESKETVWKVEKAEQKEVKRNAYPPFTTSTLTQTASNNFGYTSKKTMKLAQDLYEEGLITYHRTDSLNLGIAAINSARAFIKNQYGAKFAPEEPNFYKTKSKSAQEAHEAIRPTNVREQGSEISKQLGRDHQRLYELIWKRFVASQMTPAVYEQNTMDISAGSRVQGAGYSYLFRATGSEVKFPGWQKAYGERGGDEEQTGKVPLLEVGALLELLKLLPTQHFTEPLPRYTEASLIKALEEQGIGRPSTYAPIISTILDRHYVEIETRRFRPTPIGVAVNDFLVENFDSLINVSFTAKMEDQLDEIAEGKSQWVPVIDQFYKPFETHLDKVTKESERVKIFVELTSEKCPDGHPLVIRYGRFGKFLACEKFPEHKFTKNFEEKIDAKCPQSGHDVVIKRTRRGRPFYGCSGYPECKWMSWQDPTKAKVEETPETPN